MRRFALVLLILFPTSVAYANPFISSPTSFTATIVVVIAGLLLEIFRLKLGARDRGISSVQLYGDKIIAVRNGEEIRPGGRYPRVTKEKPIEAVREIRKKIGKL